MNVILKVFFKTPLYLLFFISAFIPRTKKKFCFGGAANSKYYFFQFNKKKIKKIWISEKREEVALIKRMGYIAYYKWSFLGLWHSLTSAVYIITHSANDINQWTSNGAMMVNLFHGLPIKKIGFDDGLHIKKGFVYWWDRVRRPWCYYPQHILLTTSPFVTNIFRRSFVLDDDAFVKSMLPRNMFFFEEKEHIISLLSKMEDTLSLSIVEAISKYSRCYIYMPTWRDDKSDFIKEARIDFDRLNGTLKETNSFLIMKFHPNTKLNVDINQYGNIHLIPNNVDVYPLLPFTDVLITDYSSVYFDYILLNKGVIIFDFDVNDYVLNNRDLNIDMTNIPAIHCDSFDNLLEVVKYKLVDNTDKSKILELYWDGIRDTEELNNRLYSL